MNNWGLRELKSRVRAKSLVLYEPSFKIIVEIQRTKLTQSCHQKECKAFSLAYCQLSYIFSEKLLIFEGKDLFQSKFKYLH
jgi:hypothetical protein